MGAQPEALRRHHEHKALRKRPHVDPAKRGGATDGAAPGAAAAATSDATDAFGASGVLPVSHQEAWNRLRGELVRALGSENALRADLAACRKEIAAIRADDAGTELWRVGEIQRRRELRN